MCYISELTSPEGVNKKMVGDPENFLPIVEAKCDIDIWEEADSRDSFVSVYPIMGQKPWEGDGKGLKKDVCEC